VRPLYHQRCRLPWRGESSSGDFGRFADTLNGPDRYLSPLASNSSPPRSSRRIAARRGRTAAIEQVSGRGQARCRGVPLVSTNGGIPC
jgi:hypothetical protein